MEKETAALVQALIDSAKGHDFFFEYSDDYRHWSRCNNQRNQMNNAFAALDDVDPALAVETWNKIAPKHFHFRPRSIL